MNLQFDPNEIESYARLRANVAALRAVGSELDLAKRTLPELEQTERDAIAAIEGFPIVKLIAFDAEVSAAFSARRRAELIRAALKDAIARLKNRLSVIESELTRDFKDLQTDLRWKVKAVFPSPGRKDNKLTTNSGVITPECSAAIGRVVGITAGAIADRAEALHALAVEFGAELPEATV